MNKKELKSNLMLLLAAAIWGFAFVSQRIGAKYLGAFTFNGIRFMMGGVSLIPLLIFARNKNTVIIKEKISIAKTIRAGMILGVILFVAASLQQVGMMSTTAGKAGFITGLYLVLVPVFGIFLKHRTHFSMWIGVFLAFIGLYLLSVTEGFKISKGDLYVLIGAIFWTCHILSIDYFTKKIDALWLSFVQFVTCSVLSLVTGWLTEKTTLYGIEQALIPLLYGGLCSVGIAYTLQAVGQKHAKPSHAAILLSLESVFASIGGALLLKETMGLRGYTGCGLMLAGMLISQLPNFIKSNDVTEIEDNAA